jgi:GT2 family glycosyltransferase
MNESACTIVIATHNRCERLIETLERLRRLPEEPAIIVVDNGSTDDTAERVAADYPFVRVLRLARNIGAAARNVGARAATTRYVAFCDDDCWWQPGALRRGAAVLDAHAGVAVLNACVMIDGVRIDEACALMAASRLPKRSACAGTAIAAFMAGAAIVRRSAFLDAGGFHPRYHLGAEESLLALDLLDRGWELIYDPSLVVAHAPYRAGRRPRARRIAVMRNRLWTAWLRRSPAGAWRVTAPVLRSATHDAEALLAVLRAFTGLRWIVRERRQIRTHVERLSSSIVELPP